jgi:hypothetical protein
MSAFARVFQDVPVSVTTVSHWPTQDRAALDSAARKIEAHGADPWVFTADVRRFAKFAGAAEYAALNEMASSDVKALLPWSEEDWEMF